MRLSQLMKKYERPMNSSNDSLLLEVLKGTSVSKKKDSKKKKVAATYDYK